MASGVSYGEVREALARLGLRTDDEVAGAGLRVFRMQMPLPFDPASVRAFARGLSEIVVVEEKLPNIETLVKDALYAVPDRPLVVGKFDDQDRPLFPGYGSLTADSIAPLLRRRLEPSLADRLAPPPPTPAVRIPLAVERTPFYCSGCPHNRSTEVPDGSLVGAGIGCHTMVLFMDPARVGDVAGLTCMGNEGTQWIGMAPFVDRPHLIQNLGDGTYFHSGQLAVTAAVAAGVNITYKLLYNGAVAMTGGQQPQGQLDVPAVSRILLEQGVKRVLITADDPSKYRKVSLPASVDVWPRERLVEAQETLARDPGRHGAHPRPDVRGGGSSPAQAGSHRIADPAGGHQPSDLRRLRGLRRGQQLFVGAAGRDPVGAQDPHRPDHVQPRLLVPGR